jgi:hypothetical protein
MMTLAVGDAWSEPQPTSHTNSGDRVIAIDVLLLPDATMVAKAKAANALLRENYPRGYTLGKDQVAHISLVHAYVREKDLRAIEVAVAKLAEGAKPLEWELTANGYTSGAWDGLTITTIGIERTRSLDELQAGIQKIVGDHAAPNGTTAAFTKSRELPKIEPAIVAYVKNFASKSSGKNFHPHVTVGVAHEDFVERMKQRQFKPFTFKPTALAIYQLGSYGTAQKKLWEWKSKARARP